jgi:nucleotide-binding universal stress UspA family protein
MQIGNILVPYDGSEHSNRAFDYALDLAKKYKAKIVTVSCILEQNQFPETATPEGLGLQRQRDAASQKILTLESKAEELGVNFKGMILKTDSVTDAILSYEESNDIDIIIVGSRGLGGFKKLVLGSVASTISQYSKCPVMIVK